MIPKRRVGTLEERTARGPSGDSGTEVTDGSVQDSAFLA